jgi:hypothetical protein
MLDYLRRRSTPPRDLLEIISEVRARWRAKLILRGAVRVVAAAFALFILAAYGMEWAKFSPVSIISARVLMVLVLAASVFVFLVKPLRRKVTDEQVALYLEEHDPSLQATLISAIEETRRGEAPLSPALVHRLVEQAIEQCCASNVSRTVEEAPLRRWGVLLAASAAVAVTLVVLGPAVVRNALSAILLISRDVEAAAPYKIDVAPGNATVPKGADQTITARLQGFDAKDASLMARRSPEGAFEPLPLVRDESGTYEGMVFDVAAPLEYYVDADGVRSQVFTLKVVDVPYVQRLELEYVFPAYTGLEPQKIEDGGDIAVLRGTEVRLRAFPTMKTPSGRVALNDKDSIELSAPAADGALAASFKVDKDGFYRIELQAPTGERVAASPQYTIDVLTDQPPSVSFSKPGRDTTASPIEEVFVEATAEDDFGVRDLELVYSVNGGPEKTVKLFAGQKRLPEVSAGHTFYMEELNVQPGDSVSYFARAADNDGVQGGKRATSDLYFLRVRPFNKDFRQAASQGGGGGGGGGGAGQVEALSEQQRQIISATFNVQRDRRNMTAQKLRESSTVVSLSQSRLREQVEGLLTRLNSQLVQRDPAFAKIVEMLPQAVESMKEAEAKLAAITPDAALPFEHKALQILQKAEEEYEQQISVQRNAGGGGGGGGSAQQQELAEIFEQELEKMASRYETANQAMQQQGDREVDELLEKLKELARRQEQEAERQRRRALEMQQAGGGGGGGGSASGGGSAQQRALAEQAEEAARRLERLAREEQRPDLMESARQMREAADAMRRAAAGGDANASAQAQAALERLRETERRLQRSQSQRAQRDIEDAIRQADEIARQQQDIADDVRQLANQGATANRGQQARAINQEKEDLEGKLNALEQQLDRAARDSSKEEKQASRKMAEAAGTIRDNRLQDKVRYSRNLVNRGATPQAFQATENEIAGGIEDLRKKLQEAAGAVGQSDNANRMETALERARRLARGLESMQERTRERAQQQAQQARNGQQSGDQQGREGQQGQQQGQNGQQGQQGQQGQGQGQGQQGQNGQAGQGQGQGQQGGGADGANGGADTGGFAGGNFGGDGIVNNGLGYGYGWDGWWRNGRLSEEAIRQLRGEIRQWTGEAQDLRRLLNAENMDPRELDEILRALRQLDDPRVYKDVSELQRLQTQVAEGLKRFEFGLRRRVDADGNTVVLTGSEEVPEEFKKLVQEYYRSLAKGPAK